MTAEDAALALLAEAGDGSMRDALSIMDQAIASAPMEAGRPVLSAEQIRELMGSVPNAVFERLLEAVAAGQSAELMEQLNVLVNAGHSPSSLARQMVRYLRNALMAKLGGEQTELLQISGDERARAGRTALLFSEEELTRNLQIVLRTFDDLNYRQEQRFHLELGLLKLIHAQRLLPIEELLSGVAAGGSREPAARSAPVGGVHQGRAPARAPAPSAASRLHRSRRLAEPAELEFRTRASNPGCRNQPPGPMATSRALTVARIRWSRRGCGQRPSLPSASPATGIRIDRTLTGALAMAPETSGHDCSAARPAWRPLRHAIGSALVEAGHSSAAQLLGAGAWTLEATSLRIEVPGVGKKMLALTVNAAAEKIIRQELQRLGAPTRFLVVPGEGDGASGCADGLRHLRGQHSGSCAGQSAGAAGARRFSRPRFAAWSICVRK